MKRNLEIHTESGARVSIEVHQFMAGGVQTFYANSSGKADIELDIDSGAEITIYINGNERVSRHTPKKEYYL